MYRMIVLFDIKAKMSELMERQTTATADVQSVLFDIRDKMSEFMDHQTTTDVLSVLFDVRDKMSEFRSEMEHQIKELNLKEQVSLAIGGLFTCIICKEVSLEDKLPMMPTCYRNIVCCRSCLSQWLSTSNLCPHCRQVISMDDCMPQPPLRPLFELIDLSGEQSQ